MIERKDPRKPRRVRRPGSPEADPSPQQAAGRSPTRAGEDVDRDDADSNDDRLRSDRPPHWG